MNLLRRFATVALVALALVNPAVPNAQAVTIDMVTVGDPGNENSGNGRGRVDYVYQIGKYEVTIGQYTNFLNAVGTSVEFLYSTDMGQNLNIAGIARSGSSGSYTYSVMENGGNSGNRPISYVNWFSAARFANWMSNGQPTGALGPTTTENGAYDLSNWLSGTAPAYNIINPNTGTVPLYRIPTENEWVKAAYYSPLLNSGSGGYYAYATQSDSPPGNTIGGGSNQANYRAAVAGSVFSVTQQTNYSSSQNYLTEVGAFTNSASYYGTFDQSGNVREWNDLTGEASSARGFGGGDWGSNPPFIQITPVYVGSASVGKTNAGYSSTNGPAGFRLAAPAPVPEPSTVAMALAGLACGGFSMLRRRKRA